MTKSIRIGVLTVLLITGMYLIYWFYLAPPTDFPGDEAIMEQMNEASNRTKVTAIQGQQFIDKEHVVVPFKTSSNNYGISHWIWDKHEWKMINMDGGDPVVWKVNPSDPSSYVITWNIHPDDRVTSLSFYLLNERRYRVSYNRHFFTPGVQMVKHFSSLSNTYGFMKMPDDWAFYLERQSEISSGDGDVFYANPQLHVGWSPFNQNDERIFPENTGNVAGYSTGHGEFQFVSLKDDADLENVNDEE